MRHPGQNEMEIFARDEAPPSGGPSVAQVARDWGVDAAVECAAGGYVPIWRMAVFRTCDPVSRSGEA